MTSHLKQKKLVVKNALLDVPDEAVLLRIT